MNSFELSIQKKMKKKKIYIYHGFNQNITMISEESSGTENWTKLYQYFCIFKHNHSLA